MSELFRKGGQAEWIDWTRKPSLRRRIRGWLPCWIAGHFWLRQDPLRDPRLQWCVLCDKKRRAA